MRGMVLAAALCCLLGGQATAGPSATFTWTGWYAGADAGYSWNHGTLSNTYGPSAGGAAVDGATIGGHLGYLWQLPSFVVGIEGDGAWVNGYGEGLWMPNSQPFWIKHDWSASIRGVLGASVSSNLLYVTGGVAFAGVSSCVYSPVCQPTHHFADTLTGWTVGVGIARALSEHVVVRAQYLHAGFGTRDESTPSDGNGISTVGLSTSTLTAGISLKF